MLLVIDVGNTNIVLGLYKKEKLVKCWRMTTGGNRTADETGIFIHGLLSFPLLSPILCILSRRGFANISISNR